jgi:hypothetical protein
MSLLFDAASFVVLRSIRDAPHQSYLYLQGMAATYKVFFFSPSVT